MIILKWPHHWSGSCGFSAQGSVTLDLFAPAKPQPLMLLYDLGVTARLPVWRRFSVSLPYTLLPEHAETRTSRDRCGRH